MRTTLLCCLLLLPAAGLAQGRNAYKGIFQKGMKQYDKGNYAAALTSFQKAYSLQEKAITYRGEGTFTVQYLPRYRIALCHEKLKDLLQAEEWANLSKTAIEADVIKKKKKDLATYNTDIGRILKDAGAFRKVQTDRYQRKLDDARSLITR